ncbi:nucleotide sugar dehydrogenase [Candidatus Woesearchaeota archaeon]|nr:nucleotide sugar dehydrogenase [Candidatus Woesearchaeota archaeon]
MAWYQKYNSAYTSQPQNDRGRSGKVAIVGLGYVGLPLALALAKHFSVVGYDVNSHRIAELKQGRDARRDVSEEELRSSAINFSNDPSLLKEADMIIVCVPTPVDKYNKPDLQCIESASRIVGEYLRPGAVVVFESTVYPGATEEVCVPLIEKSSGLKCGIDFKIGYSPERVNPGDTQNTVDKVVKIVSGMDEESLEKIDRIYSRITKTHRAPSIKVAEAAKVIENIQRDLNIALMNELAVIFDKMDINIQDVLTAAGTKWNFHRYHPGLVGGHCIGVDPYYLTYKAEGVGHHPEVILAGRRINDTMHKFYAGKVLKRLAQKERSTSLPSVLVLGLTFKPNVTDYRNSRVKHFIEELKEHHICVEGYDPLLDKETVEKEFGISWHDPHGGSRKFDLAVLAVRHDELLKMLGENNFQEYDLFHFTAPQDTNNQKKKW